MTIRLSPKSTFILIALATLLGLIGSFPNLITQATGPQAIPSSSMIIPPQKTPSTLLAEDTFQRTMSHWGYASDGQLWDADANTADAFSVQNGNGQITGTGAFNAVLGKAIADADVTVTGSIQHFQVGQTNFGILLRWSNARNWYKAYLDGKQLIIAKNVEGTITYLAAVSYSALDKENYSIRFKAVGTELAAMAWKTSTPTPSTWMETLTDSSLQAGRYGIRVIVQKGSPVQISSFVARSI